MAAGIGMLGTVIADIPSPAWGGAGVVLVPGAPPPPAAAAGNPVLTADGPGGGGVVVGVALKLGCTERGCSAVWSVLSSDPTRPLMEVSSAACTDRVIALVRAVRVATLLAAEEDVAVPDVPAVATKFVVVDELRGVVVVAILRSCYTSDF